MKNTRWITKRLMKMTCRLHVGYEIVGYKKKMCVAVIPSILEAALAGVTPANNIGHRTKIAMDNLLRTLPMVLAKQACTCTERGTDLESCAPVSQLQNSQAATVGRGR